MPDHDCLQRDRSSELQQILLGTRIGYHRDGDMKKDRSTDPVGNMKLDLIASPRGHVHRDLMLKGQSAPKQRSRRGREGTSKHFGVRFRPDLRKWVAEIRVAEWTSVDKKVWLGTFDTETGAARAVDAARKLLHCRKKRPPNVPCSNLDAYSDTLPSHLNLHDLGNDAMFKDVTLFVKQKAQQYAASLGTSTGTSTGTSNPTNCVSVITSSVDQVPALLPLREPNLYSVDLQQGLSSNSDEDSNFPTLSPTSSIWTSSCSVNSQPDDELQWAQLFDDQQPCSFDTLGQSFRKPYNYIHIEHVEQSIVGCVDHATMDVDLQSSWILEQKYSPEDELMLDNMLVDSSEYLIQVQKRMDVLSEDEMPYNSCSSPTSDISFQKPVSSTVDTSVDQLAAAAAVSQQFSQELIRLPSSVLLA